MAGGKGKRMRPLTANTPKALLNLQGRPILAWSLMSLQGIVDHALIVVHYLKAQIAGFMAKQKLFRNYTLVDQLPEPLGTGHALHCCGPHLQSDEFIVINGDDLYSRSALLQLSLQQYGILSLQRDDFEKYGVIVSDDSGYFRRIDEKPPPERYSAPAACSIGAYKFTESVFDYQLEKTKRGEYEISDYVSMAARDHNVAVVDSPFWLPIGDPAALDAAQSVDIARWIPITSG